MSVSLTEGNSGITATIDARSGIKSAEIRAIMSKSHAHRLFIAAALSKRISLITAPDSSNDIDATKNCLTGLGAHIRQNDTSCEVTPINHKELGIVSLDCGESGATLRFMLPVIGALGIEAGIQMHGRLSERPLSPLYGELVRHGMTLSPEGSNPLYTGGLLTGGDYSIAGNVSSEFITGLLFALPLCAQDSTLLITEKIQSRPYIDITLDVLRNFRIKIDEEKTPSGEVLFRIKGNQEYQSRGFYVVDGDWSNAAFFLAAGAIGNEPVTVTDCNTASLQGDMKILSILKSFGATITTSPSKKSGRLTDVTVSPGKLTGTNIDAANIPDLVPIISVVASVASGTTIIKNIERLRIKESDRVKTIITTLSKLGADISESGNLLIIKGVPRLRGGSVDSFNDHRIAMSAAIAAIASNSQVIISDEKKKKKSYPTFYKDLEKILN